MTPEQTRAAAEVMLAYAGGKFIEWRVRGSDDWGCGGDRLDVCWNWRGYEYRVKPEPREFWGVVYEDGSVTAFSTLTQAERESSETGRQIIVLREVIE